MICSMIHGHLTVSYTISVTISKDAGFRLIPRLIILCYLPSLPSIHGCVTKALQLGKEEEDGGIESIGPRASMAPDP